MIILTFLVKDNSQMLLELQKQKGWLEEMHQQANTQQACLHFSFRTRVYPNPKYSDVNKTIKSLLEIAAVESKATGTFVYNKGAEHQHYNILQLKQ